VPRKKRDNGQSPADQNQVFYRRGDPEDGADHTCRSGVEAEALILANRARTAAGSPPFFCLDRLSAMAAGHAAFLAANEVAARTDPHGETPGLPYYSGATLAARGDAAGLDRRAFWLSEGAGAGGSAAAIVAEHLATVYHRSHLLTPGGRYLAVAVAAQPGGASYAVLNSLAWVDVDSLAAVVYPGPGQTDVPCRFNARRERPDPVPALAAPGYPVSVHFPRYLIPGSASEPQIAVRTFSLTEGTERRAVSLQLVKRPADGEVAPSDAFLVPATPLAPQTRYQAHVTASYGRFTVDRDWWFTTGDCD